MAKQTFTTGQVLTAAQMTSLQQTAMLGGAASAKTASYTLVAADAGTAISMSNASATTITVNTALFAAGDTVHITNLGAGVCTITAGTATVNSSASLALAQYESGFLDFTSTSAAIFVKGAGAAPAAGSMTLLSTTTLSSAVTTISSISQDYNTLFILVYGVTNNTGNRTFNMRPNGSESISTLAYQYGTTNSAGVNSVYRLSAGQDTTRTNTNNAYGIYIYNYTSATNYKPTSFSGQFNDTAPADIAVMGAGSIATNSAITSLGFDAQGGVTFSSGTVLIYGVK